MAEHVTMVQSVIHAEVLNSFLDNYASDMKLPPEHWSNGDALTLYVPVLSHAKRLLMGFAIRDGAGDDLPILSREESAQVAALDLQTLLKEKAIGKVAALEDADRAAKIRVLLAAIVFQNPHRLSVRIDPEWKKASLRIDRGLSEEDLRNWIATEVNLVMPQSADVILTKLEDALNGLKTERTDPQPPIFTPEVRPDGLRFFPTVRSMLLHGAQDLMKAVVQAESAASGGRKRLALLRDPAAMGEAMAGALAELDALENLLKQQPSNDKSAVAELARHFDRYTVYAIVTIRLGVPFLARSEEIVPLLRSERRPRLGKRQGITRLLRTYHDYPLAAKDALGVHAELVVSAPELLFGAPQVGQTRDGQTTNWKLRPDVFGDRLAMPGRRIHLYSSRRPEETSAREPTEDIRTHIYARVRIKMIRPVIFGYLCAAAAFALSAVTIAWVTAYDLIKGSSVSSLDAYVTVGGLAVTFALLLTGVRHPNRIAHQKIWWARYVIAGSAVLTIGALAAYAIARAPI
jgi:hypothetical protein